MNWFFEGPGLLMVLTGYVLNRLCLKTGGTDLHQFLCFISFFSFAFSLCLISSALISSAL